MDFVYKKPSQVESDRPVRETIIQSDEITNLVILLNTTKSVSEFLERC